LTDSLDPCFNLALEEQLLHTLPENTAILYLWRNDNTVVIGRNQNAWRECRTELMRREGCTLVRRMTGGGAVYHDANNLNFTFITPREDYDYARSAQVIIDAVGQFGISAEVNGRNDIVTNGAKFSGNAFTFTAGAACHHGTILLKTDTEKMSRYLQVSAAKLSSKGIKSVKSRVVNLTELNPEIDVEKMKSALIGAFERNYGPFDAVHRDASRLDADALEEKRLKYASYEFCYGMTPAFDVTLEHRFAWGGIELCLRVKNGFVDGCVVYSDALDTDFIDALRAAFVGCPLRPDDMAAAARAMGGDERCAEIAGLLEKSDV